MALLNPGDEVLLFEPFYGYHVATLKSMRVKPVLVALAEPDWALDTDALKAAITPRTRAIILNTPANPSGKVFSRAEIEAIADACREHDLFLFTDEIYEYFVYDGARHISPATLPGMRERTIVMSGFSKTFSITGWRLGYATADAKWMGAMAYFHDLTYVCAPSALQHGAAAGLEQLPPSFYTQIATDHQSKRERMLAALRDAGFEPSVPAGAYYVLARVDRLPGETAAQKARAPAESDRRGLGGGKRVFPPRPRREPAALLLRQAGPRPGRGVRAAAPPVVLNPAPPFRIRAGGFPRGGRRRGIRDRFPSCHAARDLRAARRHPAHPGPLSRWQVLRFPGLCAPGRLAQSARRSPDCRQRFEPPRGPGRRNHS